MVERTTPVEQFALVLGHGEIRVKRPEDDRGQYANR